MVVVVTGSAGFIGGQTVLHLSDAGCDVIGIDWESHSEVIASALSVVVQDDFSSEVALEHITKADAVVHCAGTSLVGPSIMHPSVYYDNNFVKTKAMLDAICQSGSKTKVIFSSSASVYGEPTSKILREENSLNPMSPYGESKLMIEFMLRSYRQAYGLNYVALRYFNAAGADNKGRHGQAGGATHLIARILESIIKKEIFTLNGKSYSTPDGTCVRDYVHVDDIANAHKLCLSPDLNEGSFNLGAASGHSNLEIVKAAEKITGEKVQLEYGPPRPGDPASLTADSYSFMVATGWRNSWTLEEIIEHAWNWYCNR